MLEINVKTIDGQNRSYSVPDDYTVKQFKEKIANSLNIPVERQRLIFQGRELKDTNSLQEFDINGKTLHLVQRVPPPANQPAAAGQSQQQPQVNLSNTNGSNIFVGGFPGQNGHGAPDVTQLIQHIISGLGDLGQNATFNTTTTGDANGMEVQIDLSNMSQLVNENEIRSRIRNIRRFLSLSQSRLNRLEEIQSGAPLDDTPNSSIIVGSIHGTASVSDASGSSYGTIGFDINHLPNLNIPSLFQQQFNPSMSLNQQQPQMTSTNNATLNPSSATLVSSSPVPFMSILNQPSPSQTSTTTTSPSSASPATTFAAEAAVQAAAQAAADAHITTVGTATTTSVSQPIEQEHANLHAAAVHAAAVQAANIHAASVLMNSQSTFSNSNSVNSASIRQQQQPINITSFNSLSSNENEGNNTQSSTTINTSSSSSSISSSLSANNRGTQEQTSIAAGQQNIGVEVLGDLIQSVMEAYARFLPYLQHYHAMLLTDESEPSESNVSTSASASRSSNSSSAATAPVNSNLNVISSSNTNIIVLGGGDNRRQRFCNNINDMMHLLGHLFHNLSDLHINIRDRPPRQIHTMNSMQHSTSAVISAAVPIEANIQIPFPPIINASQQQSTNNPNIQQERLNQMRQQNRHRNSQSFSGDLITPQTPVTVGAETPLLDQVPINTATSPIVPGGTSTTEITNTEATDLPIPLPFDTASSDNHRSRNQSIETNRNSNSNPHATQQSQIPTLGSEQPPPISVGRASFFRSNQLFGTPGGPRPSVPFHLPPIQQLSTLNSYDQFLPCNSVHFYNTIIPSNLSPPSSHSLNANNTGMPRSSWRIGNIGRGRGRGRAQFHPNAWQEEDLLSDGSLNSPHAAQRRRHAAGDHSTSAPVSTTVLSSFNLSNPASATNTATTGTFNTATVPGVSPTQPTQAPLPQTSSNMLFGINAGSIGGGIGVNQLIGNILASQIQNRGGPAGTSDNQHIRVNIGGIPGQISIQTITAQNDDSNQQSSAPGSNPSLLIENLLQNFTSGGSSGLAVHLGDIGTPQINQQQQQGSTSTAGGNSAQMVNALMREAISLMDSNNTNDQRLNQPLREFMRLFDEDEEDEVSNPDTAAQNSQASRSTLSVFNTLFSWMTLGDMINLARGQETSQVFERSRLPLRTHIRNYLPISSSSTSNKEPLSDQDLDTLVDRLYRDVFINENGLHIDLNQFTVSEPSINFAKSFETLMKHHLNIMLRHVFDQRFDESIVRDSSSNSNQPALTWSSILFQNFHNLVNQLVTLSRVCLTNADSQFTLIVTQKLRQAVSSNMGNNSMFYGIFENFVRTQIQQTLSNINLPRSTIDQFIAYKETNTPASFLPTQQTTSAAITSRTDNLAAVSTTSNSVAVDETYAPVPNSFVKASALISETDNQDSKSTDSSKSYETVSSTLSMDIDLNNELISSKKSNSYHLTKGTAAQALSAKSSWKQIVPTDWMPIIEKDLEIQSQTSAIRSYSDAYCSGMPAKRRRILSSKIDFLSVNLFKKVLNRTLEKVQLKPNINQEQLVEESVDQAQLIDSFSVEFNSVVDERLRQDPDFNTIVKSDNEKTNSQISKPNDPTEKERFLFSRKRFS